MKINEKNIILRTIIELKPQFEKMDGFVSKEWIIQKKNEKGFFKSLSNIWKRISDIKDDEILYGFSEGVLFTDKNIIFLNHEIFNYRNEKYGGDYFSLPYEVPEELKEHHNRDKRNEKVNIKLPLFYSNLGGLEPNQERYGLEEDFYGVYCDIIYPNNLEIFFNRILNFIKLSQQILKVLIDIQTQCKSNTSGKTWEIFKNYSDNELITISKLVDSSVTWKLRRIEGLLTFYGSSKRQLDFRYKGENKNIGIEYISKIGGDWESKKLDSTLHKLITTFFKTGNYELISKFMTENKKEVEKWTKEFDKDDNGKVDTIEGDDFMKLFRKHQTVIKEFDKEYINHLVKISNYLKTKRSNIQNIFKEIKKSKHQSQLNQNVGLLKNQIHTYEVLNFHSLSLITSIVEDDLITVNEIYEEFDKLKIFKSDHEKEVSQKLSEIGDGLNQLLYSINSMERNIVSGLNQLSYLTQEGFSDLNKSVTRELQSINSNMNLNNLLTGIQTYQMYKINKNTKGLKE